MRAWRGVLLAFGAAWWAQVPLGAAVAEILEWRRLEAESGIPLSALAWDAESGNLALGSAQGVWRTVSAEPSTALRPLREPLLSPVRDLAFLADASLLAVTDAGLYALVRDATPRRLEVGVGEGSRDIRRIAVSGERVALATRAGVYLGSPSRGWRRLSALPPGPASQVVVHRAGSGARLYAYSGGSLWQVELAAGQRTGFPATRLRAVPGALGAGPPLEIFTLRGQRSSTASARDSAATQETALGVVYASALALYSPSSQRWQVWRPAWPPGAQPRRYARALGRHWLATDRGLLFANQLAGPWQRATAPLGALSVAAIAGGSDVLYAASALGAFRSGGDGFALTASPSGDPPIAQLQRAVLVHQGLGPEFVDAMRRGAARRGWWPRLSLVLGYEAQGARNDDFDQSVVSGVTHYLHDRERERDREFEVGLALAWELGDVAFDPEQVDVSREARALVALRGDVLDEVTQLYFDRQRVLGEALTLPADDPRRAALALRARELAARLDGWSGGWFSAQGSVAVPPSGIPAGPR